MAATDLSELTTAELEAKMHELDVKREALREEGRTIKEALTARLRHESVVAKLQGLDPAELEAVLAMASKDPSALAAAVEKSRKARPAIVVEANAKDLPVAGIAG